MKNNIAKKIKLLDFKLTKAIGKDLFGAYKSKFHGNGMEFAEHREYNFGDSVKNIDWKASAKTENIQVKKYEEFRDINVLFLIDLGKTMNFGNKKEILEQIFYALAFSAIQNNDNLGAYLYDEEKYIFIPLSKNSGNIFKILEKIENFEKLNDYKFFKQNNFENIFEVVNKNNKTENLIFVLTDKINFEEKIYKKISVKNEIVYINIFDYLEKTLDFGEKNINITFTQKNFLNINLDQTKKISKYKNLIKEKIENFKKFLEKFKIIYLEIDDKKNLYKELIKIMQ